MSELPLEAARESGLVRAGEPLLVMVSGGGDSVALLDVALRLGAEVSVLHVNYGLREEASLDQALVERLCGELGVPLRVEQVELGTEGNLQERAREARYALAETLAVGDYAAAHTASDQVETVLYRLAVSPGSRALRGMAPRRGRLVRPLLGVTRGEVRDYLRARGLEWREDPSNADRRFARARVRHDVLDALRELSPAAERTIAETARQLRDEAEVLDVVITEAVKELGGGPAVSLAALLEHPPAVRRLVLRALAERAAGPPGREAGGDEPGGEEAAERADRERAARDRVDLASRGRAALGGRRTRPLSRREADEILALGDRGTKSLDLGGGLRAVVEYGTLRFTRGGEAPVPEPVPLSVPGRARFGDWEVEARVGGPGDVTVSGLGGGLTVRAWRDGDRMRPAGLGGSKSLQDLFTDRKVPRALRRTLPVVEADGEIVWVAGVAVGERFAAEEDAPGAVGLSARSAAGAV
jgi:tRNA(Ile)-lysidine synthase